jgi:predicted amidohydrolase
MREDAVRNTAAVSLLLALAASSADGEWTSAGASLPRKVVVATTMFGIYGEHPGLERRLADAEALIDEAGAEARRTYPGRGLDLVVLTETLLTASGASAARERAVPLEGPVLDRMGAKAREYRAYLVVPMMLAEAKGDVSNAAVLLDRAGHVAGIYRKVHPVTDPGTDVVEGGVAPGRKFPVFETDFGRLGIQICWDAVYEDGWEALARQRAEIVAFPSAAPHIARPAMYALRGDYWVVSSTPLNNASIFNPLGMVHAQITSGRVLVQQIDLSAAAVHWLPGLDEGRSLTERFGDRVGCVYYESEATGLFWSNDPKTSISEMLADAGFIEMAPYVERNRRAQDAARGGPLPDSE